MPPSTSGDSRVLLRLEEAVEKGVASGRGHELARLHSDTVDNFVNSSGFGVRADEPRRVWPKLHWGLILASMPPAQEDYFRLTPKDHEQFPARPNESVLGSLHEAGFLDFVNPRGFGYVKSRRESRAFNPTVSARRPSRPGNGKSRRSNWSDSFGMTTRLCMCPASSRR